MTQQTLEELQGHRFTVLDDGFVSLVDVTGSDSRVVDAARLTSGSKGADDRTLLRYLMRHRHDTPFEFAGITIHIRIPMDAWRQMVRHRLFSINEYSTRYSPAIDSQQKTPPDQWRLQATNNRQGSAGYLPVEAPEIAGMSSGENLSADEQYFHAEARRVYQTRLRAGVAREQARKDLPLSTYTEAWVECDLRGWLHFLGLRMDSHAQKEIRDYATIIGEQIIKPLFPLTWEAFEDYRLGAVSLTRLDALMIERVARLRFLVDRPIEFNLAINNEPFSTNGWNLPRCRERDECRSKLVRLGILPPL